VQGGAIGASGMAIALDASASGVNNTPAIPISLNVSHTIGGGAKRLVVVCAMVRSSTDFATLDYTTITYDGTAMSLAATAANARSRSSIYYLLDASLPAAGTYTVAVTANGTTVNLRDLEVQVYSFTGAKQSAQPDATNTYQDNTGGSSISKNITTVAANAWIVDALAMYGAVTGGTAAGSQANAIFGAASGGAGSASTLGPVASPGSTATGWGTFTGTNPARFAYAQASFAPDS
jgi:hypothetical protein